MTGIRLHRGDDWNKNIKQIMIKRKEDKIKPITFTISVDTTPIIEIEIEKIIVNHKQKTFEVKRDNTRILGNMTRAEVEDELNINHNITNDITKMFTAKKIKRVLNNCRINNIQGDLDYINRCNLIVGNVDLRK